jgi:hypothetical protein
MVKGRPMLRLAQRVASASKAAVSAPVTTRQIVAFDGGPVPGRAAPHRRYSSSRLVHADAADDLPLRACITRPNRLAH